MLIYTLVEIRVAIDGEDEPEKTVRTRPIQAGVDCAGVVARGPDLVKAIATDPTAHLVQLLVGTLDSWVDIPRVQAAEFV